MYANIIVDISYEKLDRVFQYRIPESLKEKINAGSLVEIPFGNGNRLIKGYVVGFSETTAYPEEKIKLIHGIVEGSTTVEGRMIKLAWWMRKMYGSTMNQTLKTVVPVKQSIKGKEKKTIIPRLSEQELRSYLENLDRRSKGKARLLEALSGRPALPYEMAVEKLHTAASTLQSLEADGVIEIVREGVYRNPSVYKKEKKEILLTLTEEQQEIAKDFEKEYRAGIRRTYLVHGITGSGKTEVYMEMIASVIKEGKQAIVLIPEIALTFQTVLRFYQRFDERVSIMNSRMSQGERYDQYERAKRGEVDIVIGPRSALFVPLERLGLIVIDEEHEGSYKSESVPKYHARETAGELAKLADASLVLGSATPSMEAYFRALKGEYKLYQLNKRAKEQSLPAVHIVDLREELREGNKSIFSRQLHALIKERLEKRQQTILFINRRGYAGFVSCRSCGKAMRCPHCDVGLTVHTAHDVHRDKTLRCHYCGYSVPVPSACPSCGSGYIAAFGTGTQKVEEAVRREFPEAGVLRMDMDTTSKKDGHEKILSAFANHEADILIGTQMIVKGHDFPLVTLVGVIAADLSLFANDYHSAERTFQLLTQAAGRAGRGSEPGEVVIQTYNPGHYSIVNASKQDYAAFYEQEMLYRALLKYPPAGHLMAVLCTSAEQKYLDAVSVWIKRQAELYCEPEDILLLGPADAGVSKINDIYRKVLYAKHEELEPLLAMKNRLELSVAQITDKRDLQVQFDVDPMNAY